MPIKYQSGAGQIFICTFSGTIKSEMCKRRPVIAFTAPTVAMRSSKLCHIVPLSTTPPEPPKEYHLKFTGLNIPGYPKKECWAKCDMIYTVSYERLDAPYFGKDAAGNRRYTPMFISHEQLLDLRGCILCALQYSVYSLQFCEIKL